MRARYLALAAVGALLVHCANDDVSSGDPSHVAPVFDAGAGEILPRDDAGPVEGDFVWELPSSFPIPVVPEDNPMSRPKVELGRHLFYDARLSGNRTQSCASCHDQKRAFTDGRETSVGSTGEAHPRSSMALANVGYVATVTWANPLFVTLEQQVSVPLFNDDPVELGMRNREGELVERLRADARYRALFPRSFPHDASPITVGNVVKAIAAFERTLVSARSPYDRFLYDGDVSAISESAKRGGALFNSEKLECFHCHNGFNLMDSVNYRGKTSVEIRFHNTGLYNIGGGGAYPVPNRGVMEVTERPDDMGRFRAPSLRNVAVTAPYMHDGSVATLDGVLDHYSAAGRTIANGPNAGVGSRNPYKSSLIVGFTLSASERADVLDFLGALTDSDFLTAPRFANPWEQPCPLCE